MGISRTHCLQIPYVPAIQPENSLLVHSVLSVSQKANNKNVVKCNGLMFHWPLLSYEFTRKFYFVCQLKCIIYTRKVIANISETKPLYNLQLSYTL
jgi:nucleosome binding factor SPN SPT16 subunit